MAALFNKPYDRVGASPKRRGSLKARPLILVVEDHDDTRFLFKTLLEMWGCGVVEADNGLVAIDAAEREHPDLILMDTSLPRLDGLAAMRRIRQLATLKDVPIVVLSGYAEPAFRTVALAAGCNDYMVKPVDLDQLGNVLEKHIGKNGLAKAT